MKALLIVDPQNDFFEGGMLAVNNSNSIIPTVNKLIDQFEHVIFTKDWHPAQHKSFAEAHEGRKTFEFIDLNSLQQILWPVHCVQNTKGAEFKAEINFDSKKHKVVTKGSDKEVDSYSGFFDNGKRNKTELDTLLKKMNIDEVYVCGLAMDFCVKYTAIDAAQLQYKTYLVTDATLPVDTNEIQTGKAINEMKEQGVNTITSETIQV